MQYEADTPQDYIASLTLDWRADRLKAIRQMILNIAPELTEGIEYKMLCYHSKGNSIFHLNAQKNYVSLYVGDIDKVESGRTLLSDFDMGKGCIRVKKKNNLENGDLLAFIQNAVDYWRDGGEIHC